VGTIEELMTAVHEENFESAFISIVKEEVL